VFGGGVPDMPDDLKDGCWSSRPSGPACRKPLRWCARKSLAPAATSSPSTPKKRPCAWCERHQVRTGNVHLYQDSQPRQPPATQLKWACWINSCPARPAHPVGSKQSGIGVKGVHSLSSTPSCAS